MSIAVERAQLSRSTFSSETGRSAGEMPSWLSRVPRSLWPGGGWLGSGEPGERWSPRGHSFLRTLHGAPGEGMRGEGGEGKCSGRGGRGGRVFGERGESVWREGRVFGEKGGSRVW